MKTKNIILIFTVYISVSIILSNFVNVSSCILSNFIYSFFASINYFLIPTFIGFILFFPILRKDVKPDLLALIVVASWISGMIVLLAILLLLVLLNAYNQTLFVQISIIMLYLSIFISFFFYRDSVKVEKAFLIKYLVSASIALLPLSIFKFLTGFPGNYSILGYRFAYISESMVQRNEFILDQLTNYAPLSQIILSINSSIYKIDSYSLTWFTSFILQIIFFNGVYVFLYTYLKRTDLAFFASILSAYIIVWDTHYFTPPIHDLQPRVLAMVIFPYLLIALLYAKTTTHDPKKYTCNLSIIFFLSVLIFFTMHSMLHPEIVNRKLMIIPAFLSLGVSLFIGFFNKVNGLIWFTVSIFMTAFPIIHIFEGAYYITLAYAFGIFMLISSMHPNLVKKITYVVSIIVPFILYGIINGVFEIPQIPFPIEAPNYYGFEYQPKFFYDELINFISHTVFYAMIVGMVFALIKKHSESYLWNASLLVTFLVFAIYFLPIPDIIRISAALAPFVPLYVAYGVESFVDVINETILARFLKEKYVSKIIGKSFLCYFILALILFSATNPFLNYIGSKMFKPEGANSYYLSLVADYEYKVAVWIRNNLPKDAIIISDPETMYIIAGISGRKLPIAIGMLVQDLQIPDLVKLYWIRFNIINMTEPEKTAFYARILGKQPVIVISCRTIKWLDSIQFVQQPCYFNISGTNVIKKFLKEDKLFKLLYKVDDRIYVFTLQNVSYDFPMVDYKIYLLNNASRFSNVTIFSRDWRNSTQAWYLEKIVVKGKVTTLDFEQYISNGGSPPIIKWTINVSSGCSRVDVYLYNLYPINSDKYSWFILSSDGKNWVEGNFAYPLAYVLTLDVKDHSITFYGKSVPGKFTRIGAFVLVEWFIQKNLAFSN
jgi:hypothetical protein